jgi:hypothetical protein
MEGYFIIPAHLAFTGANGELDVDDHGSGGSKGAVAIPPQTHLCKHEGNLAS